MTAENHIPRPGDHPTEEKMPSPLLRVIFIHLDLGIGGAEQLVLQLATASRRAGHDLTLVTTRCDPTHCFAAVKPPDGPLYPCLRVWGRWIPTRLVGPYGQAFCSTLRLMYLALALAHRLSAQDIPEVIVVDVLPTPLPLLRWLFPTTGLLFYCHFPDKLLTRRTGGARSSWLAPFTQMYRYVLDGWEESSMRYADTLAVNSQFTLRTVQQTFPSLARLPMTVLYPALDTTSLDRQQQQHSQETPSSSSTASSRHMIVSLNRYERKKNLGLLIQAVAWLRDHSPSPPSSQPLEMPHVVIAGGYDVLNAENVEYRQELQVLADHCQIPVDFRQSISETERSTLLQQALCVVYTPDGEHFGIVPLEAMYAGTPVVAVRSGGPLETVVDGVTGYLCEPTPAGFGQALGRLLSDPAQARAMGQAGREHVQKVFGEDRLLRQWQDLVASSVRQAQERSGPDGRRRPLAGSPRLRLYLLVLGVMMLLCVLLILLMAMTWMVLRPLGILSPELFLSNVVRFGPEL